MFAAGKHSVCRCLRPLLCVCEPCLPSVTRVSHLCLPLCLRVRFAYTVFACLRRPKVRSLGALPVRDLKTTMTVRCPTPTCRPPCPSAQCWGAPVRCRNRENVRLFISRNRPAARARQATLTSGVRGVQQCGGLLRVRLFISHRLSAPPNAITKRSH